MREIFLEKNGYLLTVKTLIKSDLGLHCLPVTRLGVSQLQWVIIDIVKRYMFVNIFLFLQETSAHDGTALHCTEPFIITFPSSRYDLINVEIE